MALIPYRFLRDLLFILSSSLLLVLSFPAFDMGWLAWVGLVPMLLILWQKRPLWAFLMSWLWGMLFFLGLFNWMLQISGYRLLHHAILAVYLGSYFGFFGIGLSLISKRYGVTTGLLVAPFLWVSLEFVRGNLSFLALPWALLAHSQYQYLPIIQFASFTGAYGISFLIVMVNAALTAIILKFFSPLQKLKLANSRPPSRKAVISLLATTAALTGLALFYGQITLSRPIAGEGIKVSVVQANIEQKKKWDKHYANDIIEIYTDLTRRASEERPMLIVWPESATPGSISRYPRLKAKVTHVAREAAACLLLGSSQYHKFRNEKSRLLLKYTNSAYLIRPDSKMATTQRYDKIRLLPFTEYLPLKGIFPWSYLKVLNIRGYLPGKEFTVFEFPPYRFSTTICWENIFPDVFRQFVKRGAQFMINITNEARFGNTSAPYHFLPMSVLRAVENRVFVIRCANTGVSCFIDPFGRIVDRVRDTNGEDIFVQGTLTGTVIPLKTNTFYTRHGEWLVWLSILVSAVFLGMAFLRKNPSIPSR